ncbi:MAG: sigma-70 family RNA polymerase sigma factor [Ruminobacter sp.]|uniref:sigma-70 family RNA polymerase sigma factor n=1 Tax=Ruminobacter sp. TaxID=2774296 RepID=UPI001B3F3287|nr:sigma-70 family RNA polymerase sigma factor [Ruminobacter sp.]MBP3749079.1 sigma-70 family RNA polymerase sigma factor [Ruminobacter sp.]
MATRNNNDTPIMQSLYQKLREEKLLEPKEEHRLAETIKNSNRNICSFIAEAIFIVKFILDKYDAVLSVSEKDDGKLFIEKLVIGFTDTTPAASGGRRTRKSAASDQENESDAPEIILPGNELMETAPRKFAELRELYSQTVKSIRTLGKQHETTTELQKSLRNLISTFIFTPALFNEIIEHINLQFSRVREICGCFKEILIDDLNTGIRNFKSMNLHAHAKGGQAPKETLYWIESLEDLPDKTLNRLKKDPAKEAAVKTALHKLKQLERFTFHDIGEIINIYNNIKKEFAKGIEARNIMIRSNIRLVMYEARKFNKDDDTFNDLTQYGILGLIRAIEKFDYTMGFKLSTYATCWIRQYMNRALNNDFKSIRLPANKEEKIKKIKRFSIDFYKKNGRDPKNSEISEAIKIPVAEVAKLKFYSIPTVSLNESVNHENGDDLFIENVYHVEDQDTPQDNAEAMGMNESIMEALKILPHQECDVLKRRFGLGSFDPQTLEEIAKLYGVKAERIRQIEEQALRRLKTNSKFDFLKDWVGSTK